MISLDMPPRLPSLRKLDDVENAIYLIRGQRVMLDSDLAAIYGTTTRRLNERLRRNRERFPIDFAFRLTADEFKRLMSQIATSKKGRGGFAVLKRMLEPEAKPKREIGFHVRERAPRYRAGRNS